ncbi:MAG: dephospho-CoA kinase [Bacteroidetes bacterium]|jgi:dephospho-CoA kinase|nr:dephospho-CoA kinase [Bacteroidota bacterium]
MKTLGVTGGIGSGKSTVCRLFEDLGARVFVADDVAKQLMQQDPAVRRAIVDAFGPASYDEAGRLDRAYLAQQVFSDEENVARINAIVHPRVFDAFREEARRAEQEGVELLVHEAALIFEAGGDRHLDAVAVVDAPEDVRVRRVVERDGVAPEQVRARMRHQLPPEELRRRADFVIDNSGAEDALHSQVQAVYDAMVTSDAEASPDA